MPQQNCKILSWNVRGLNEMARRDSVQELIQDTGSTIVCIQETKLAALDNAAIFRTLGPKVLNNVAILPMINTRGGILLAASDDFFSLSQVYTTPHTISASITMKADNSVWWITGVYGSQSVAEKHNFLQELKNLASQRWEKWLVRGDFNLVYQTSDKNNRNLNRYLMGAFKSALDILLLKEIHLKGRRYTWSNGHASPTLTRIDRIFYTSEWKMLFPNCYLHSLPSLMSDHTPLLLQGELTRTCSPSFRFENFWVKMVGFKEAVQDAWSKHVCSSCTPLKRLHIKLARTAKDIKAWHGTKVADTKL
jgi:exonuclease III